MPHALTHISAPCPRAPRPPARRNLVPKHVHESRPIVPVTKSTPKDPQELFEPFNLVSLDRHNKQVRPCFAACLFGAQTPCCQRLALANLFTE